MAQLKKKKNIAIQKERATTSQQNGYGKQLIINTIKFIEIVQIYLGLMRVLWLAFETIFGFVIEDKIIVLIVTV